MSRTALVSVTRWSIVAGVLVGACASYGGGPYRGPGDADGAVSPPLAQVDNAYVLASMVALPATRPIESEGLHNVFKLSRNVVSGSEPLGDEAFSELAAMGIRTIVSVDGKTPDADGAAKLGLRYVHIPIEYRGISGDELLQLTKTFREREGPFYVHCFHGKHRGPAAAAVGRVVLDGVSREVAIAEMRQWCGTAPEYEGLYRDVATKPMPGADETRGYAFDFPARRRFTGMREVMVAVSRRHDALKTMAGHDFALDAKHPDVVPAAEAFQLARAFEEAGAQVDPIAHGDDFRGWLGESREQSRSLADALARLQAGEAAALDPAKRAFAELSQTCNRCHAAYRNH